MTVTKPPPVEENGNGHSIALWAGVTAFLVNLAAINIVVLLNKSDSVPWKAGAAFITALLIGASVYARERLSEAKEARERHHHHE